jgi:hypothetical protein
LDFFPSSKDQRQQFFFLLLVVLMRKFMNKENSVSDNVHNFLLIFFLNILIFSCFFMFIFSYFPILGQYINNFLNWDRTIIVFRKFSFAKIGFGNIICCTGFWRLRMLVQIVLLIYVYGLGDFEFIYFRSGTELGTKK